jgi:hypothetical protein
MNFNCSKEYWGVGGVFARIFSDYLCYVKVLGTAGFPSKECSCGMGTNSEGNAMDCGAKIHTVLGNMRGRMANEVMVRRDTSPPPVYACDPPFAWQNDADCFCTEKDNQVRIEVNLTKLRGASEPGSCSEGLMWCAMARLHKGDPTDTQSESTDSDCRTGCPVNSSDYIQDLIFGNGSYNGEPPSHLNITLGAMPELAKRITSFIYETKQALANYNNCINGKPISSIPKPDNSSTFDTGREFNP